MTNFSCVLANSTATFGAATGSAEVAITVGGGLGESDIGGPLMNIVPKSGGNTFSGSAFLSTAGDYSSGDNLTDDLRALNPNLRQAPGILSAYDWNGSVRPYL